MHLTRIVMIGGFLGAGKTTTISRLASMYQTRGRRVAIITNDHAGELVDTVRLRSQGFQVGEIPGGCFCGNIEAFMAFVDQVGTECPDLILVEPIGSCIDLAATVIRPLRQQSGQFEIAPYCVIIKSNHVAKILRPNQQGGFSPQAEYLFRKQLEEADLIAINRIDQLTSAQVEDLSGLLAEQYPGVPSLRTSARTGQGFETLVELLDQQGEFGMRVLDVDYQEYAAAEAEFGWLNGSYLIRGRPFDLDRLLADTVGRLRESFVEAGAEIAHLKLVGLGVNVCGVVNLVSSDSLPETSLEARHTVQEARLIVNARVAADPNVLATHVRGALEQSCQAIGVERQEVHFQCFRPGRPVVQLHSISSGNS